MKRAVSISIGSSKRDKAVEIELLGEKVRVERIGTDGDMEKAAQLYKELDGKVDAFGVGGADLYTMVEDKRYPLYSVWPMIRYVKRTPIADGAGLLLGSAVAIAGISVLRDARAVAIVGAVQTAVVYGLFLLVFRKVPQRRRRKADMEAHPRARILAFPEAAVAA